MARARLVERLTVNQEVAGSNPVGHPLEVIMIKEITLDNFAEEVLESDVPVLLDFWAGWCAPCKMVSPVVEEIAEEYESKLKVGKVDIDGQWDLAQRFNITGIPALIVMNKGEAVASQTGAVPRPTIENLFKDLI